MTRIDLLLKKTLMKIRSKEITLTIFSGKLRINFLSIMLKASMKAFLNSLNFWMVKINLIMSSICQHMLNTKNISLKPRRLDQGLCHHLQNSYSFYTTLMLFAISREQKIISRSYTGVSKIGHTQTSHQRLSWVKPMKYFTECLGLLILARSLLGKGPNKTSKRTVNCRFFWRYMRIES